MICVPTAIAAGVLIGVLLSGAILYVGVRWAAPALDAWFERREGR